MEVISEKPFEAFLEEQLLEPLGMHDTRFTDEEKFGRLAAAYKPSSGGLDRINLRPRTYPSGSSGLRSTAADYFRFCQMTLNGGIWNGTRVLSRKTVELMTSNHIGDLEFTFRGSRFGLGYLIVDDTGESAQLGSKGTYSWGGAFGTVFWVDPEEELIGILMIQLSPLNQLQIRSRFKTLVYVAIND